MGEGTEELMKKNPNQLSPSFLSVLQFMAIVVVSNSGSVFV